MYPSSRRVYTIDVCFVVPLSLCNRDVIIGVTLKLCIGSSVHIIWGIQIRKNVVSGF